MKKEYCSVETLYVHHQKLIETLNDLGSQGWKVVESIVRKGYTEELILERDLVENEDNTSV